jgi:dTDP-4-dehydrorhamnose reductase
MSILIIGASGFIGNRLAKGFSQNCAVYGTSTIGNNDFFKYDILNDKIEDILNQILFDDSLKIAIITIAIANIDRCFKEKSFSYKVNVEKMLNLISILNDNNFKVIFLSTDFVFDGKNGNYTEESIQSPSTEYGKQKAIIEQNIFKYSSNNVVVRLSKTVSNKKESKNIFNEWFELVKKNQNIVCIKGQKFVPTDVEDVIVSIEKIIENDLSGIYNIVANRGYYRGDLAQLFLDKGKINHIKIVEKDLNDFHFVDNRSLDTTLNNSKIKEETKIDFKSMELVLDEFWSEQ